MYFGEVTSFSFFAAASYIIALAWPAVANARCLQTCTRSSMMVNYGFDAKLRPLEIDLGVCIAAEPSMDCGSGLSQDENYTEFSNGSSCDHTCVPGDYNLKPYSNRTSAFMAPIVNSCRPYNPTCSLCRLTPRWITAFPASSFKSTVNVGMCEGTCPESAKACIATNKKTVAVSGPNGVIAVEKTVECGCRDNKCYREDYYESYWEVVNSSAGAAVKEKVINVGRCKGDCNGIFTPKICLPTPERCVVSFGGSRACCNPATRVENFVGLEGQSMSVATVTSCNCL